MIPRSKWNTFSHEDQIAWSKISEQAKKAILNTPDNKKGSDSNPLVIVNNHEMIFKDEDKDEDTTGNGNHSISAQTHSSSNRSIVASVHQSGPARRTIQANASTLQDTSESKHQEPEERGLLCRATHKTSKSNQRIDVNSAFSKAIEKKSTSRVSWDNDIEQPTSERYKKPQLQVNVARWKKDEALEDGTLAGLESSDEEEKEPGEQTNPRQTVTSTQVTPPPVAAATRSNVHTATCGYNTRQGNTIGGGRGRGRGRGHTLGSHCFGAGGGGQSYRTEAPDGRTHLIPRSARNTPPQPLVTQQCIAGVTSTRDTQMIVSNRPSSYVARYGRNLPVATDMLGNRNSSCHRDVREGGTFAGLEDDGEDTTGNSHALVSCDARPDQVVSHYAITPYAGRTIVPCQTGDNEDRPQGSATSIVTRTSQSTTDTAPRTRTASQVSIRNDGTMAGLELDEENDNDSKGYRPKSRAIVMTTKGNRSKPQTIAATTTHDAEHVLAPRATQENDPQDVDLERGATSDSQDPQDDPQDVDLERGATDDSQADPLDSDPDREVQVNPQPLPAISHEDNVPINEIEGAEDHEMDEQSHLGHDPEMQIQIPIPEIPNDWQPPTSSYIERELGLNPLSSGPDLSPTRHTLWRPSNPSAFPEYYWRPSNPSETPEFDENGDVLGIDSDDEGNPRTQNPQQGDIKEDGKVPALVSSDPFYLTIVSKSNIVDNKY